MYLISIPHVVHSTLRYPKWQHVSTTLHIRYCRYRATVTSTKSLFYNVYQKKLLCNSLIHSPTSMMKRGLCIAILRINVSTTILHQILYDSQVAIPVVT